MIFVTERTATAFGFLKLTYNQAVQELWEGITSKNATKITKNWDLQLVKTGYAKLYNSYTV
jgi:hypothetical protein